MAVSVLYTLRVRPRKIHFLTNTELITKRPLMKEQLTNILIEERY